MRLEDGVLILGAMKPGTAAFLAQVIPALLVAGILGPLLSAYRADSTDRKVMASYVGVAVLAEAICLFGAVFEVPIQPWAVLIVLAALLYSLLGIMTYPLHWARRTDEEQKLLAEARDMRREKRLLREAKRKVRRERRAARQAATSRSAESGR